MGIEKVTDIDEVPFHKLNIGQDEWKEEPLEVTELLVPPPSTSATADATTENTDEGLTETKMRLQREEEKFEVYDRIYVSLLSEEEDSNTETDESMYTHFG